VAQIIQGRLSRKITETDFEAVDYHVIELLLD
jgi:hypothetical protein